MTIESTNEYEIVGWERPIFKDNSGKDPRVSSSRPAGTRFRVPGKVQVSLMLPIVRLFVIGKPLENEPVVLEIRNLLL
jgi:hypothetical protein